MLILKDYAHYGKAKKYTVFSVALNTVWLWVLF